MHILSVLRMKFGGFLESNSELFSAALEQNSLAAENKVWMIDTPDWYECSLHYDTLSRTVFLLSNLQALQSFRG